MENTNNLPATMGGIQMTEVQRIMGDAPQTFSLNKQSTQNVIAAGDRLLENVRTTGMSDTLDGQLSVFVDKAKRTLSAMNDRRKPFTQIMDAVKKELTTLEADVKTKIGEVQAERDAYATKKMEEQRERERKAQMKLAKEQEAIELSKNAELALNDSFSEHLMDAKQALMDKFNGLTLSDFEAGIEELRKFTDVLTPETYKTFRPALAARYHSDEDINEIIKRTMNTIYPAHKKQYVVAIVELKRELMDKRESKLAELRAMEAADSERREQMEKERREREAAEQARIAREASEQRERAAREAETRAAGSAAHAEITAVASVGATTAQVKEGYEIIIKEPSANLHIVQMWFMNEGKEMSQEKIDRVTFERMRKFCEKQALATGEFIDSPLLEYREIFKAK